MTDAVRVALAEDIGAGDVTSRACVPESQVARGRFLAREPMVVAGLDVAQRVYAAVDSRVHFRPSVADGDAVAKGAQRHGGGHRRSPR